MISQFLAYRISDVHIVCAPHTCDFPCRSNQCNYEDQYWCGVRLWKTNHFCHAASSEGDAEREDAHLSFRSAYRGQRSSRLGPIERKEEGGMVPDCELSDFLTPFHQSILSRRASEITIWPCNALSKKVCIASPECEDFRRAGAALAPSRPV